MHDFRCLCEGDYINHRNVVSEKFNKRTSTFGHCVDTTKRFLNLSGTSSIPPVTFSNFSKQVMILSSYNLCFLPFIFFFVLMILASHHFNLNSTKSSAMKWFASTSCVIIVLHNCFVSTIILRDCAIFNPCKTIMVCTCVRTFSRMSFTVCLLITIFYIDQISSYFFILSRCTCLPHGVCQENCQA